MSEALAVRFRDIDMDHCAVHVRTLKHFDIWRDVPLPDNPVNMLDAVHLIREGQANDYKSVFRI